MRWNKVIGYLLHDVIAHPICGALWIVGAIVKPWSRLLYAIADSFHDITVLEANFDDEFWPPLEK